MVMLKKYKRLFFVILFPYFILFIFACIFTDLGDVVLGDHMIYIMIPYLLGVYIAGLISAIVTFIVALAKNQDGKDLLKANMIVKLAQIPAYLCLAALGFMFLITIFTMGFTIVILVVDIMAIIMTGIVGLAGVIQARRGFMISNTQAVVNGILQFFFIADVISAIYLFCKARKAKVSQNMVFNPR